MTREWVDAFASLPHYRAHLEPIWEALPEQLRGEFTSRPSLTGGPVLVAAYRDAHFLRRRPRILCEHGVGQSYTGTDNPSYAGGRGHEGTILFIVPNEQAAAKWRRAYPDIPVAVTGSVRLEHLREVAARWQPHDAKPRVAVSFHFNLPLVPETRWAFPEYREHLKSLTGDFTILGHGHPRAWRRLEPFWRRIGIEPVSSFDEVLGRADLFVCDNSSALYEFSATGRPVVALNASHYRRDVDHGLRFWDLVPGAQCDHPEDLEATIRYALSDPPEERARRDRCVEEVLGHGGGAERAADAIAEVLDSKF